MRPIHKKLLGLLVIGYGIYLAIEAVSMPGGLTGPVFREWTGLSNHDKPAQTEPAAPASDIPSPASDIPTPSDELNK